MKYIILYFDTGTGDDGIIVPIPKSQNKIHNIQHIRKMKREKEELIYSERFTDTREAFLFISVLCGELNKLRKEYLFLIDQGEQCPFQSIISYKEGMTFEKRSEISEKAKKFTKEIINKF